jgi:hypothetical protein
MLTPFKTKKSLLPGLVGSALLLASNGGIAAEWSVEPSVTVSTSYSDNIKLLAKSTNEQPIQSNIVFALVPSLKFGHQTEVRNVLGTVRVAANRFNKDDSLNSNDAFFDINWTEKGERSEFSFISTNSIESTLGNLLETVGVPTDRKQRQRVSAYPNYTYNYNARGSVGIGYRFEDTGMAL